MRPSPSASSKLELMVPAGAGSLHGAACMVREVPSRSRSRGQSPPRAACTPSHRRRGYSHNHPPRSGPARGQHQHPAASIFTGVPRSSAKIVSSSRGDTESPATRTIRPASALEDLDRVIAQMQKADAAPTNVFPVWQQLQYVRDMSSGRGKLSPLDNARYPSIQNVLCQVVGAREVVGLVLVSPHFVDSSRPIGPNGATGERFMKAPHKIDVPRTGDASRARLNSLRRSRLRLPPSSVLKKSSAKSEGIIRLLRLFPRP